MFNGKMKAVTFSYDDGVTQDKRLIEMLDKYGLKATFNVNSECLGMDGMQEVRGMKATHNKVQACDVREIYKNHEVAVHTLTHPMLPKCDTEEVIRQVEQDRINLSELVGYEVVGMAYPGGGTNHDDRVVDIIKNNTGVKYARTIISTYSFDEQKDMHRFNPTIFHLDHEKLMELGKKFIEADPKEPMLFYIWGHSYEFDFENTWDRFEEFCKLISGHDDIFYGTNREVFGY